MKKKHYLSNMKKISWILVLMLFSCQFYVTETKNVTVSGKYVVSKLEITNVDQNQTRDSLYSLGSTYVNKALPHPFNNIPINRFYIHFDYSTIRMDLQDIRTGQDIWRYGVSPNEIFYKITNGTPFYAGYLQFDYVSVDGKYSRMTFMIEDDGFETLQLKSSGAWFDGKMGQKQVMTMQLTRVGP